MQIIRSISNKILLAVFIILIASSSVPVIAQCPTITVTNPSQSVITAGVPYQLQFTASGFLLGYNITTTSTLPAGSTFTQSASTGVLSGTALQTGSFPIVVTATTQPNQCSGTNPPYVLQVVCPTTPITGSAAPSTQTMLCSSGTLTPIVLSSGISATTFSWTRNNTTTVTGMAASGTGSTIVGTLTNTTTAPVTVTFTITPTAYGSCLGTPFTATVVVNPSQTVNQPANQVVCNNGATLPVSFTGSGSIFSWTNNSPAIGLPTSGTGNISSFTATNTTNAPAVATVTVTGSSGTGNFAYLRSYTFPNSIDVVNLATNAVVATIPLGSLPGQSITSRDGTRLYVLGNELYIINTATNTVVSTVNLNIGIGGRAIGIALSPDGSRAYISCDSTNSNNGFQRIRILNTATSSVIGSVILPINTLIFLRSGMVVSPDGSRIYVASDAEIKIINTATNTMTGVISLGAIPEGLALSPDGSRLYTTDIYPAGTNNLGVINTATNTVITGIPALPFSQPYAIAVSPDGSRIYVTNSGGANSVSVINTVTNTIVANIPTPTAPRAISISPDGSRVYVSTLNNNFPIYTFYVINTATNSVISSFNPQAASQSVNNFIAGNVPICTGASKTFTITVNPTATINAVPNQLFCNGIASTPINFSSPTIGGTITYNWTNSNTSIGLGGSGTGTIPSFTATNTTAAPVSATITVTPTYTNGGASCNGVPMTFTITVNPLPSAAITVSGPSIFCQGGSVTLTAPPGLSYLWSNGPTTQSITVSTSGNFSVIVTNANNCSVSSATTTVTVNPLPASPTISANGSTNICQGGSITLTAPGGFTYLWSTGATTQSINVNTTGNYSVIVKNANNCTATSAVTTVTVSSIPTTPVITAGGPTTFCEGGSVTLTAPAGFTYLWSNGATSQSINVSTSGNYSVTITNANNCSALSAATTVTANPRPAMPIITQAGNTLFSSSPTGNQWYLNGVVITGATTASYTYTVGGNYSVTVTSPTGCSSSSSITTAGRNGVFQITDTERFYYDLFPNPVTSSQLTITYQIEQPHTVGVSLFNMNGRRINIQAPVPRTTGRYTVNANTVAERLQKGVYILKFTIDGKQMSQTVIKL